MKKKVCLCLFVLMVSLLFVSCNYDIIKVIKAGENPPPTGDEAIFKHVRDVLEKKITQTAAAILTEQAQKKESSQDTQQQPPQELSKNKVEEPVKPAEPDKPKGPIMALPEIPGIIGSIPECKISYIKWETYAPQKDMSQVTQRCTGKNNLEIIQYLYFLEKPGEFAVKLDASYKPVKDVPKIGDKTGSGLAETDGTKKFIIYFIDGYNAVQFSVSGSSDIDPVSMGIDLAKKAETQLPKEKTNFSPVTPMVNFEVQREKSMHEKWTLPPILIGQMTWSDEPPIKSGYLKENKPALAVLEQQKSYIYFWLKTVNDVDIPYIAAIKGRSDQYHMYIYASSSKEGIRLALNNASNLDSIKEASVWLVFDEEGKDKPVAYQTDYTFKK